mmetsp:Transcript_21054/g.43418  ORF Transcript_21054/g.43418 Transcript_21054/m.43418 type:complete len:97 (-) Transcript_21054:640-930(-)
MHLPRCEDYREPAKGDLTAFAHAWTSAAEVGASSLRHHRGGRTGRFGLSHSGFCGRRRKVDIHQWHGHRNQYLEVLLNPGPVSSPEEVSQRQAALP